MESSQSDVTRQLNDTVTKKIAKYACPDRIQVTTTPPGVTGGQQGSHISEYTPRCFETRPAAVCPAAAEDALGEDHAAGPEEGGGGRVRQSGRPEHHGRPHRHPGNHPRSPRPAGGQPARATLRPNWLFIFLPFFFFFLQIFSTLSTSMCSSRCSLIHVVVLTLCIIILKFN